MHSDGILPTSTVAQTVTCGGLQRYDDDAMETVTLVLHGKLAFPPPFLLLVHYDHGTDVYGKNAQSDMTRRGAISMMTPFCRNV